MAETEIMMIVAFVVLGLYLIVLGLGVASYIMNSLSLYTIANRRLIKNSWLSWIPIANSWIQGSIADDYDERNGIKRKWRIVLLTLSLISHVGIIIAHVVLILSLGVMAVGTSYIEPELIEILKPFLAFYGILFLVVLVAGALQMCKTICLYKIFESTVPKKSLKYMLLSLLVPLAESICLMKCRKQGYSKEVVYSEVMPEVMQEINVPTYMPEKEPTMETEAVSLEEVVEETSGEDEAQL